LIDGGFKKTRCQLDTGSDCNIIGLQNLHKVIAKPRIQKPASKIVDVQKKAIEVIGEVEIPCIRDKKKCILVFQVVNFEHQPLLSEDCYSKFVILRLIRYNTPTTIKANDYQHLESKLSYNQSKKCCRRHSGIVKRTNSTINSHSQQKLQPFELHGHPTRAIQTSVSHPRTTSNSK
jgi:hypothetical protein